MALKNPSLEEKNDREKLAVNISIKYVYWFVE